MITHAPQLVSVNVRWTKWFFLLGLVGILLPAISSAALALSLWEVEVASGGADWNGAWQAHKDEQLPCHWLAVVEAVETAEEAEDVEGGEEVLGWLAWVNAYGAVLDARCRAEAASMGHAAFFKRCALLAEGLERYALFHQLKLPFSGRMTGAK